MFIDVDLLDPKGLVENLSGLDITEMQKN